MCCAVLRCAALCCAVLRASQLHSTPLNPCARWCVQIWYLSGVCYKGMADYESAVLYSKRCVDVSPRPPRPAPPVPCVTCVMGGGGGCQMLEKSPEPTQQKLASELYAECLQLQKEHPAPAAADSAAGAAGAAADAADSGDEDDAADGAMQEDADMT
jgi:hypothetical protein